MDRETKIIRKYLCNRCKKKFELMFSRRHSAIKRSVKIICSLFEFIKYVEEIQTKKQNDEVLLFRGHAREDYELKPSLFRKGNEKIREREAESIRRIEIAHPRELAGMSTLDKLAMLQHYEFPTRLLDFSLNPLVGLFFASNSHREDNGAVIVCRVSKKDMKQFDDLIVKNISEIANNKKINAKQHNSVESSIESSETSPTLHQEANTRKNCDKEDNTDETKSNDNDNRLILSKEANTDLFTPVFVETKRLNPRIAAQKGAFLLFGLTDEFPETVRYEKVIIYARHKAAIMKELEQFGIDDSIMFPGFEHFLLYLREKMKRGE